MNEFQQVNPYAYGISNPNALVPQGLFGSLGGGALGGLIGRGIGGIFNNPSLGGRIGQTVGGIGGAILPFGADPVSAAYAQQCQQQLQQQMQQGQLAPQGWFGNLIGQVGQPLGSAIGGIFGHSGLGGSIGNVAGQIGGLLPFGADPVSAANAQQQVPLQHLQHLQIQQQLQQLLDMQQQQQQQLQQLAQQGQLGAQGQLAPQGLFGNILGQVGRPLGGAIGGLFGQSGIGQTIGGVAGGLGRFLPFQADPASQLLAQQAQQQQLAHLAQQAQQQQLAQLAQQQWIQQQLAQQQLAQQQGQFGQQQGQFGQQGNSYIPAFQGASGIGQQAGLYGGQQTVH